MADNEYQFHSESGPVLGGNEPILGDDVPILGDKEPIDVPVDVPVLSDNEPAPGDDVPASGGNASVPSSAQESSEAQEPQRAIDLDRQRRLSNIQRLRNEQARTARAQQNQKLLSSLRAAQETMKRRRICRGKIGAVVTMAADGNTAHSAAEEYVVVMQVMMDNGFIVHIPFNEFFRDNPIDMKTVDLKSAEGRMAYNRRQRQMAEKMYDAVVEFIITDVFCDTANPANYKILGSRREALLLMEKNNFYPSRGMEPRIKAGDFFEAQILSVGIHTVFLNVGGVDATIPIRNMTFRYVQNMADLYKVGDTVVLQIIEIAKNKQGNIVLKLDAKAAELKESKDRLEMLNIPQGTLCLATITNIRPSRRNPKEIVINAYVPVYGVPAIVQGMDPRAMEYQPMAGDEIRVSVTGYNDFGFLLVRFRGHHNASTLITR